MANGCQQVSSHPGDICPFRTRTWWDWNIHDSKPFQLNYLPKRRIQQRFQHWLQRYPWEDCVFRHLTMNNKKIVNYDSFRSFGGSFEWIQYMLDWGAKGTRQPTLSDIQSLTRLACWRIRSKQLTHVHWCRFRQSVGYGKWLFQNRDGSCCKLIEITTETTRKRRMGVASTMRDIYGIRRSTALQTLKCTKDSPD